MHVELHHRLRAALHTDLPRPTRREEVKVRRLRITASLIAAVTAVLLVMPTAAHADVAELIEL